MAYQEIKLQSNEAGPFTPQNNCVSVTIPDYVMASDLSRSSIVLNMELMNGTSSLGLYDAGFRNDYTAKVMIKNCRIVSDNGGTLEDIQASNVLTCNLHQIKQDFENIRANQWKGSGHSATMGSFIQKMNSGTVMSQQRTYFQIPLREIFGLGSMSQYPNKKFGNTRIYLEFEDGTTNIIPKLFSQVVNPTEIAVDSFATGATSLTYASAVNDESAVTFYVGQPVSVTGGLIVSATGNNPITGIAVNADTTSLDVTFTADITGSLAVNDIVTISGITGVTTEGTDGEPNGQGTVTATSVGGDNKVITVSLLGTGVTVGGGADFSNAQVVKVGAGTDLDTYITSITNNGASPPTPIIGINDAIPANLTYDTSSVVKARASGVNNTDLSYRVNEVQLLLYTVKLGQGQTDKMTNQLKSGVSIPYKTYTLERINVNSIGANLTYNRQFELEPNCVNVMGIAPLVAENDPFVSRQNHIASFRWNLNGINTTSHDIEPYDALYYDRFLNSMASGEIEVNNLRFIRSATNSTIWATPSTDLSMLVLPQSIPMSNNYQTLQLQWKQNASASTEKIFYLFKTVVKQLKMTSTGVQVM